MATLGAAIRPMQATWQSRVSVNKRASSPLARRGTAWRLRTAGHQVRTLAQARPCTVALGRGPSLPAHYSLACSLVDEEALGGGVRDGEGAAACGGLGESEFVLGDLGGGHHVQPHRLQQRAADA